jgi:hypothetical protein
MEPEVTAGTGNTVKSNLALDFGNNFLSSLSEHYPLSLKFQILKVIDNEKLLFLSGAKMSTSLSLTFVCFVCF